MPSKTSPRLVAGGLPRLPMALLAASTLVLLGCTAEREATGLDIDLSACFAQAEQDEECGSTFSEQLGSGTLACLAVTPPEGAPQVLTLRYAPGTGRLDLEGGNLDLTLEARDLLVLELLVLRPEATACPKLSRDDDCSAHEACLLSYSSKCIYKIRNNFDFFCSI